MLRTIIIALAIAASAVAGEQVGTCIIRQGNAGGYFHAQARCTYDDAAQALTVPNAGYFYGTLDNAPVRSDYNLTVAVRPMPQVGITRAADNLRVLFIPLVQVSYTATEREGTGELFLRMEGNALTFTWR